MPHILKQIGSVNLYGTTIAYHIKKTNS